MTCNGFTAVRRSRFGHLEVATTHRDGDKPGKIFPAWKHLHGVRKTATPPSLRARGGSWRATMDKTGNETGKDGKEWTVAIVVKTET
jgi:hypothetical protein